MIASLSAGTSVDDVLQQGGGFHEQQLAAYVSWVNSQLRRRPGLEPIRNLRLDLQDGVVLSHLIEIVAGEVLEGVHPSPRDKEESRKNVERVLHFISSKHIRMPHISAKDIVEGNLKSLMRIILALAAHFKPSANHRAGAGGGRNTRRAPSNHNPLSAVALAQGAAAALASARHDASLPVRHSHLRSFGVDEEGSVCVRALVKQYEKGSPEDADTAQPSSSRSLSSISPLASPRPATSQSDDRHPQQDSVQLSCTGGQTTWDEAVGESLEKEVEETRLMVSALQALLLNGALPEEEEQTPLGLDEDDAQQQLVVVGSRLDQSMEEARVLKRELLCCKQEMRNLQGVKEAQQQRLCVQEASILQMKQEVLRSGMAREELANQNAELQWKLEECTRLWTECKKEAGQKDRLLQQHMHKLEESQKQQSELQRELEHRSSVLQNLRRQDNQQIPTDSDNNGYCQTGSPSSPLSGAEELQLVRDALRSLRSSFRHQDPQNHTLDTLEQGVSSLMERLSHTQQGRGKSPRHRTTTPDPDPWPTKISHSFSGSSSSSSSTKVLFFTHHSPTPSVVHIPKRLGEVTLKDVKEAVDCEGNLRYHFKALDPEFGTVKEELFLDGAIVPGWEGKIVAWVEEDLGEDRASVHELCRIIPTVLSHQNVRRWCATIFYRLHVNKSGSGFLTSEPLWKEESFASQ